MILGFLGLGLIGGSLAKTIRRKLPETVIKACDVDEESLLWAESDGVANHVHLGFDAKFFSDCDVILLCTPVHSNIEYLPKLKAVIKDDMILTDVGSVKGEISEIIIENGLEEYFVGGHPMAGTEKSGYRNSTDRLFENAYYILTPSEKVAEDKINKMVELIENIDAIPMVISAKQHDMATAAISHVPHVIAYSLVNLVKENDDSNETMKQIAAGGFKDITRIASSSAQMWKQICMANSENVCELLQRFIESLSQIKADIENGNENEICEYFDEAREYRNSFTDTSAGPIKKAYVLHLDLMDEPGALAVVATILAGSAINIKNIGIVHNREYEEGALKVEFYSEADMNKARTLLNKFHYRIYER